MEKEGVQVPNGAPSSSDTANSSSSSAGTSNNSDSNILAPFNPTCDQAQQVALDMLLLLLETKKKTNGASDLPMVLFDLGCGDGRLLIRAIQQSSAPAEADADTAGCSTLLLRCVGIERDPVLAQKAVAAAKEQLSAEQQSRIDIRCGDALIAATAAAASSKTKTTTTTTTTTEPNNPTVSSNTTIGSQCRDLTLQDATAIYLYLLPKGLIKIRPLLDQLIAATDSGCRRRLRVVVTYMFQLRGWEPTRVDRTTKGGAPVYLYEIPSTGDK